jgi:hypothetical protein
MEPEATAIEIERLLRPGGVFASYSYHWHLANVSVQLAYSALMTRMSDLGGEEQASGEIKRWPKRLQEETLEASGAFRLFRQIGVHSVEHYDVNELLEFIKTYGIVRNVLKRGIDDDESGLAAFRKVTQAEYGTRKATVLVSWNVWIAVR